MAEKRTLTDIILGMLNRVQPVACGGTGADNAVDALKNLGFNITPILGRQSFTSSTSMAHTGYTLDVPANSYVCITATAIYNYNKPVAIQIGCDVCGQFSEGAVAHNSASATLCAYIEKADKIKVNAKYAGSSSNYANIIGFYITLPEIGGHCLTRLSNLFRQGGGLFG